MEQIFGEGKRNQEHEENIARVLSSVRKVCREWNLKYAEPSTEELNNVADSDLINPDGKIIFIICNELPDDHIEALQSEINRLEQPLHTKLDSGLTEEKILVVRINPPITQ